MLQAIIRFFLSHKLVTVLLLAGLVFWGLATSPFGTVLGLPADPVAVDAIPDIGDNQQIIFTAWPGQSPQDVEDQITYPLTTVLLGLPGVKTVRSHSMFGTSSIYVIFDDDVDFYWSRSRIVEKLNALPAGLLPSGVQPSLGPDATGLGQVFWYTLEGVDSAGNATGGWSLQELRAIQDYYVRYGLASVAGVSEVASIGGYVKEYQIEVDPEALIHYGVTLMDVVAAVKNSNLDVGAQTMEINRVEYLVRGIGEIEQLEDIAEAVVKETDLVPVRIKDLAFVTTGPASRRGILDKGGAEAVGGVVVARYGENPMAVIEAVKEQMVTLTPGLPHKTLPDGTVSKVTIKPFYDRSGLIKETIGTLEQALQLEVIITILVVLFMLANLRMSVLISGLLPVAVVMVFIAMRYLGITANIVALSGIAIAIGTMVDLGIILVENIQRHLQLDATSPTKTVIYRATAEVTTAIITAVATTVVSFLPVFALQGAEGKLFEPLAYTKTFALIAALLVTLFILPALADLLYGSYKQKSNKRWMGQVFVAIVAIYIGIVHTWVGWALLAFVGATIAREYLPRYVWMQRWHLWPVLTKAIPLLTITWLLGTAWWPLGADYPAWRNFLFVFVLVGGILLFFWGFVRVYARLLGLFLAHKLLFLLIPAILILIGATSWLGINTTMGWLPNSLSAVGLRVDNTAAWKGLSATFPGVRKEFMPALDEGAFLLMPTAMPHTGVEQTKAYLQQLDRAVAAIPEIAAVVGKAGRVESALDPAPLSMFENIIQYKPEYILNESGYKQRFKVNDKGYFLQQVPGYRDSVRPILPDQQAYIDPSELIPDKDGRYFRQWRPTIQSADDIWQEIQAATQLPGLTAAPKLQPIQTRLVMLQTGMRAPIGIKIQGNDLTAIEQFGMQLAQICKTVSAINPATVFADRVVGKPYLNITINRQAIAQYGLQVKDLTDYIETAIGGRVLTTVNEGRERYAVRARYPRETRDDPAALAQLPFITPTGIQVPLGELVNFGFERGPMQIKSENTFLTSYVLFDKADGYTAIDAVNKLRVAIDANIKSQTLLVPSGVSYTFTGEYENQLRAERRLLLIIPVVLVVIFLILYLQFKSVATTLMVFSGVAIAFSGGFIMMWLYDQSWFLHFTLLGADMQSLFQVQAVQLSVAVWVGFIALFGIATDDGVVMATYLHQQFAKDKPTTREEIRAAVIAASQKRIRPAIMTTATTLLALLPVLSASGKGSDIMIPMAIPAFGGMTIAIITLFVVPVLFAWFRENKAVKMPKKSHHD